MKHLIPFLIVIFLFSACSREACPTAKGGKISGKKAKKMVTVEATNINSRKGCNGYDKKKKSGAEMDLFPGSISKKFGLNN